jgi:hypothetical protein
MKPRDKPPSLVAEKAARYLVEKSAPVTSAELAFAVLRTRIAEESAARRVLETAFGGDGRLRYEDGAWTTTGKGRAARAIEAVDLPGAEPDRIFLVLRGARRGRGAPFELASIAALRLKDEEPVVACSGTRLDGPQGARLRRDVARALRHAVPILHDPPGALAAFERWLGASLDEPISVRSLAQSRLGHRADQDLASLASRLGLHQRLSDDPLEDVDALVGCLAALRRDGESLHDLRRALAGAPAIDWGRFAFDRAFLDGLPTTPGTYRFLDADGGLLYVGKAKDLSRRVKSYFREGARRSARVESLLRAVHRIEIESSGSDLEAILREAAAIARRAPERNVQRRTSVKGGRADRLRSILILEPAEAPFVLRAYLLRDGQLLARVPLGPKGGGVRKVERLLEDRFFSYRPGPEADEATAVDVELIARWLAAHRDSVVALDPTHFERASDVAEKLRWFLSRGLVDPGGAPIHVR